MPLTLVTALAPARTLQIQPPEPLDRDSLLADIRAGKDRRLVVELTAYRQTEEPNRNFVRFSAAGLRKLARTAPGKPFLRDHRQDELDARAGTILESTIQSSDGATEIRQVAELSAPWATEKVLRGLMDQVSIGWWPNLSDEPRCTVCKNPMFSLDCPHFPGEVVNGKTVEMLYTDVDFL